MIWKRKIYVYVLLLWDFYGYFYWENIVNIVNIKSLKVVFYIWLYKNW